MQCKKCNGNCIKNGFQINGTQRFFCKKCALSQQEFYSYNAYQQNINQSIISLLVNSCGIKDISRILNISKTTVLKRIRAVAKSIRKPNKCEINQTYEVDELCTRVNGKQCWIIYAINRKTKQVINFFVGRRTKENLNRVVQCVLDMHPKRIYTDKLQGYKSILPATIHYTIKHQTNNIERYNLNLRTHLKRLSRKTICYSKSTVFLIASLTIYFWYKTSVFVK